MQAVCALALEANRSKLQNETSEDERTVLIFRSILQLLTWLLAQSSSPARRRRAEWTLHPSGKFRLRSLYVDGPGAGDFQFPVGNFSVFINVQLVRELDQSRRVWPMTVLGALAQIVRRNALIVQSGL